MDLRKWLLLSDVPHSSHLRDLIYHVPCSDYRTANILRLFAAGYQCEFRLTNGYGQPTEALRVMVSMMPGVELCHECHLPDQEKQGFGKAGPELINFLGDWWYLRGQGLTDRVKSIQAGMNLNRWSAKGQWINQFLPGLDGAYIRYPDPDGKRRKRVCYVAVCPTGWKLTDHVYEGLWRWNREHVEEGGAYGFFKAPTPDGYAILASDPTLGRPAGQGDGGGPAEAHGAAPADEVPPAFLAPEYSPAETVHGSGCDR